MKARKPLQLTQAQIEAGKTPKGGFSRKQLAAWGVPWPPPKGWRRALVAGRPIPTENVGKKPNTKPDWSGTCSNCGNGPIVPATGMCGPCTFGEASTAGGNW